MSDVGYLMGSKRPCDIQGNSSLDAWEKCLRVLVSSTSSIGRLLEDHKSESVKLLCPVLQDFTVHMVLRVFAMLYIYLVTITVKTDRAHTGRPSVYDTPRPIR